MSISYIGAVGYNFSGSNGITTGEHADAENGDINIAVWTTNSDSNSTGTPPAGWTKIDEQDDSTDSSTHVFWQRTDGTGSSSDWSNIFDASEAGRVMVLTYRGCIASGNPQDQTATKEASGSGTAKDAPAIVTQTANALVVAIFGADPGVDPAPFTWDGGINERVGPSTTPTGQNTTTAAIYIGDKIIASPGSTSLGGDLTNSDTFAEISIALKPASEAAQIAYAITDSNIGSWTDQSGNTANLFDTINETTASSADYIRSPVVSATASSCRFKLTTLGDPNASTGHVIHWQVGKDVTGGDTVNMTVSIYQGGGTTLGAGTLIKSAARNNVDSFTTYDESLSGGETDTITNYADLYIEFSAVKA